MLCPSAESSSEGVVDAFVTNINERHRRRDSSPSSEADQPSEEAEEEAAEEETPRKQRRQSGGGGGGGSGVGGGGGGSSSPASDSASSESQSGAAARRAAGSSGSSSGVYMADSGVRQIMEPALQQLEAVCDEIGAPLCRLLAGNVEAYAQLKSNGGSTERQLVNLSGRVDLSERLFLRALDGLAGLLGLDSGRPEPPDPVLAEVFAAVQHSVERLAGRLRDSLRALNPARDASTEAEAAWAKAEAALEPRALAEALGRAADRAAWRRLRSRRLRSSGWPEEPRVFAELTRLKSQLTSVAGAAPKFHHAEAVRHLLMAMSARLADGAAAATEAH